MEEQIFKIIKAEFKDGFKGDALLINMQELRKDYQYVGLWYACDKNEKTFITTELYYSMETEAKLPEEFAEEIKENSFKKARRYQLPSEYNWIWIATRMEQYTYCRLKAFAMQQENTYINYKVIRHKERGFESFGSGLLKGGKAVFFKLGIEDGTGKIDYDDTIFYLAMVKQMPPEDWKFDHLYLGVQKLPVFVPTYHFLVDKKYSSWLGQNPLEDVRRWYRFTYIF